jgi:hypothetical protein
LYIENFLLFFLHTIKKKQNNTEFSTWSRKIIHESPSWQWDLWDLHQYVIMKFSEQFAKYLKSRLSFHQREHWKFSTLKHRIIHGYLTVPQWNSVCNLRSTQNL